MKLAVACILLLPTISGGCQSNSGAINAYYAQDYDKAERIWLKNSDSSDRSGLEAIVELVRLYDFHKPDPQKRLYWMQKATSHPQYAWILQGRHNYPYLIGKAYLDGHGTPKDPRLACQWFERSFIETHGSNDSLLTLMDACDPSLLANDESRRALMHAIAEKERSAKHLDRLEVGRRNYTSQLVSPGRALPPQSQGPVAAQLSPLTFEWEVSRYDRVKEFREALQGLPADLMNDPICKSGPSPKFEELVYQTDGYSNPTSGPSVTQKLILSHVSGITLSHENSYTFDADPVMGQQVLKNEDDNVTILGGLVTVATTGEFDGFVEGFDYEPLLADNESPPVDLPSYSVMRVTRWYKAEGLLFPLKSGNQLRIKFDSVTLSYSRQRRNGKEWRQLISKVDVESDLLFSVRPEASSAEKSVYLDMPGAESWVVQVSGRRKSTTKEASGSSDRVEVEDVSYTVPYLSGKGWGEASLGRPVGYTMNGGTSGKTFSELTVKHRRAYSLVQQHLKNREHRLVEQARRERAEKLAREQEEVRKSGEQFNNWITHLLNAAAVVTSGIQQMQAVKQGIPPSFNIMPVQGINTEGSLGTGPVVAPTQKDVATPLGISDGTHAGGAPQTAPMLSNSIMTGESLSGRAAEMPGASGELGRAPYMQGGSPDKCSVDPVACGYKTPGPLRSGGRSSSCPSGVCSTK